MFGKTLDIAEFRKHVHALAVRIADHKTLYGPGSGTEGPFSGAAAAIIEVPALDEKPKIFPARNGAYIQVLLWVDLASTPLADCPVAYESECKHGVSRNVLQACEACSRAAGSLLF